MTLTEAERARAREAAEKRHNGHAENGTPMRFGQEARSLGDELGSIGAEIAVAQLLGREWRDVGVEDDRDGDGGIAGVQVRWTRRRQGRLIAHDSDPDDFVLFLVTGGKDAVFEVHGWALGSEAKHYGKRETHRAGGECLFLDRARLWPVASWWPAS